MGLLVILKGLLDGDHKGWQVCQLAVCAMGENVEGPPVLSSARTRVRVCACVCVRREGGQTVHEGGSTNEAPGLPEGDVEAEPCPRCRDTKPASRRVCLSP